MCSAILYSLSLQQDASFQIHPAFSLFTIAITFYFILFLAWKIHSLTRLCLLCQIVVKEREQPDVEYAVLFKHPDDHCTKCT